jgi:uncharacterized protein (TIGR02598 family)
MYPIRHLFSSHRRPKAARGFSLVETVVALGIMGLAITALLGLIPHGLEQTRKAGIAAGQARIIDVMAARLANIPFTQLAKLTSKRNLAFDDQGVQLFDAIAIAQSSSFVVSVVTPGNYLLPGSVGVENQHARVLLRIAATPNIDFNFTAAPSNSYETVAILLSPVIP